MENTQLEKVMEVIPMGLCPRCKHPMMVLVADYAAYKLSESGYKESYVDEKRDVKQICTHCGFSRDAYITIMGRVLPKGVHEYTEIKKNPIG